VSFPYLSTPSRQAVCFGAGLNPDRRRGQSLHISKINMLHSRVRRFGGSKFDQYLQLERFETFLKNRLNEIGQSSVFLFRALTRAHQQLRINADHDSLLHSGALSKPGHDHARLSLPLRIKTGQYRKVAIGSKTGHSKNQKGPIVFKRDGKGPVPV
jgi:hypothetical protein